MVAHKYLVVNAGSSSIKYKVIEFDGDSPKELVEGKVEKIGEEKAIISHKNLTNNKSIKNEESTELKDHHAAIEKILDLITSKDKGLGVLDKHDDVAAVGHRLVHGGDDPAFMHPTRINEGVLRELRGIQQLAPLHTAANLTGVESVTKLFSEDVPQYVVCDTSFHSTLPDVAFRYAVPDDWYTELKKYGFHGISHFYVAKRVAKYFSKKLEDLNLITIHLGNGSSVACIRNGKSVDTSMGFTPLAGLVMGSRSGDIDAGVLDYYTTKTGKSVQEAVKMLNTQSGMKGLCGSNDMREVVKMMKEGNDKAKLAFESFCYSIRKYVGEYFFVLGGKVDAIVFTGGIGENSEEVRAATLGGLEQLGITLDNKKKEEKGKEENGGRDKGKEENNADVQQISVEGKGVKCLIVQTNEELEIAIQVHQVVDSKHNK